MYNEEQYIYNTFHENFLQMKKGNIVLYGTGIHTAKLLEKIDRQWISGLMDVKKTGETFRGYRLLSYEEVLAVPDVCIVIIARDAVIHTVCGRIEAFCREHGIPVYDIHGNLLTRDQIRTEAQDCFLLKKKELLDKIKAADYVTFDIFDTLLTRKMLSPQDIFTYMDHAGPVSGLRFSSERKKAEDGVRKISQPTIYDIYDCLRKNTGISEEEKERLLAMETATEDLMLCRRESMCGLLEYARKLGKKVYLVSDMYLTGDMIRKILTSHRITDYDGIFVSCQYAAGKQEGLFQIVREELRIPDSAKALHIGDNYFSDIQAAREAGFDTYQIYSPREMYERSIYPAVLPEPADLEEELVLGKFVSLAYNDPFGKYKENGVLVLEHGERIAELFIAPVILKYMLFLIQTIRDKKIDLVIFPSRDGYLLQKLYRRMKAAERSENDLPEDIYFYTSRRAALIASARSEEDIEKILSIQDSRNVYDMLKARFGVKVENQRDRQEIRPEFMTELLRICGEERKNYQAYISSSGIREYQRAAFVDFIAVGTVQSALEKLLGRTLFGVYFWKRGSSEKRYESLTVSSLYQSAGDFDMNANIYKFYYFLENILSSEEPSLMSVAEDGQPRFYKEEREERDMKILRAVHRSIEDYVQDMTLILQKPGDSQVSNGLYDAILGLLSKKYSEFDEEAVFHMKNTDEFMGKTVTSMNR